MILRLVLSELRHRAGRVAFLVAGYSFGVAVMVVLLSVGEAMVTQARDQALVGGGDVLILPAGISPEMLRVGGTTSLFVGLDQARFLQRQVLESPRAREDYGIVAASPVLDGRLVRMERRGHEVQVLASAEIPSRAAAVGAAPLLLAGEWRDHAADARWASPTPEQLLHEIDAFHLPYGAAVGDSTWAEWHYFNVLLDEDRWLYLTYMVGGRVGVDGEWGGRLILTRHDPRTGHVTDSRDLTDATVRFDTARADLILDENAFVRQRGGRYRIVARVGGVDVDLEVEPRPYRLFPPAELGGADLVSGYVVPALAAVANGQVCTTIAVGRSCERVTDAAAYHDHNWGVWRDVSWEWGAASDDSLSLLYGVVRGEMERDQSLFAYLTDDRGVRGVFRPGPIRWREGLGTGEGGPIPSGLSFEDARRGLHVEVEIDSYQITDVEHERFRYFVQMRGTATVRQLGFEERRLPGFFETYLD